MLDNGYVQFRLECPQRLAALEDGAWPGLCTAPELQGASWRASCTLAVTGQNQWMAPVIGTPQ
jgi:hypothetical protein